MIELHFPASGLCLRYTGVWNIVDESGYKGPMVTATAPMKSRELVGAMLTLRSMFSIAEGRSQQNPAPPPAEFSKHMPDWMGFGLEHKNRYPSPVKGNWFSYDDVDVENPVEAIQSMLLLATPAESPLYAMPKSVLVAKAASLPLEAYDDDGNVVEAINPAWEEHKTPYGFTYYTDGYVDASRLAQIVCVLVNQVCSVYPTSMLAGVPESVFQVHEESEVPFDFSSNKTRLFYYLNVPEEAAAPSVAPTPEEKEEIVEQLISQKVDVSLNEGTKVACGGAVKVTNYDGDLAKFIKSGVRAYSEYATSYKGKRLSRYAMDLYMEMFSGGPEGGVGAPDSTVKLQVRSLDRGDYVWTGASFRRMYGSERLYSKGLRINKSIAIAYEDAEVSMTDVYAETLLASLLSSFYPVNECSAQLYYAVNPLPDDEARYSGTVTITDPRTMHMCTYNGDGTWRCEKVEHYGAGVRDNRTGFVVSADGDGWLKSQEYATILTTAVGAAEKLARVRYELRESISKESVFGSYDILHTCSIESAYSGDRWSEIYSDYTTCDVVVKARNGAFLYNNGAWSLVRGYDSKELIPVQPVSAGMVCYLQGSTDFTKEVAEVISEFIATFIDTSKPEVQVSLELESAL